MAKKNNEHKKYNINITQNAENDLNDMILLAARNSLQSALRMLEKIPAKIDTLEHSPQRGAYVPELLARNIKNYRQISESPWKIIYKVDDDTVNILAIIDSRRSIQDALFRKLLKQRVSLPN